MFDAALSLWLCDLHNKTEGAPTVGASVRRRDRTYTESSQPRAALRVAAWAMPPGHTKVLFLGPFLSEGRLYDIGTFRDHSLQPTEYPRPSFRRVSATERINGYGLNVVGQEDRVCTENSNPKVLVMKSAQDGV